MDYTSYPIDRIDEWIKQLKQEMIGVDENGNARIIMRKVVAMPFDGSLHIVRATQDGVSWGLYIEPLKEHETLNEYDEVKNFLPSQIRSVAALN